MGKNKFGAKRVRVGGVMHDSKLESRVWLWLQGLQGELGFEMERQKDVLLQEKFRFADGSLKGELVRAINLRIDFLVRVGVHELYLDAKGMVTEAGKMKWKMLKWVLHERENVEVGYVRNVADMVAWEEKIRRYHVLGK